MKTLTSYHYVDFEQPADRLCKFHSSGDLFTILLKDGTIIHHTPKDTALFKKWLLEHKIVDIRTDKKA
ncbi:MAG TPA: hypothetical protein VGD22_09890 [Sphingobacteriaceae bacterium]